MRVCPINSTTVSQVRSGLPRQFWVMWQNIRCSILFHLLVPGGKWQTEIGRPSILGSVSGDKLAVYLQQPAGHSVDCEIGRAVLGGSAQSLQ